jgi:hypothetical protein
MPVPTFTNYANGTPITDAAFAANMTAGRTWLNSVASTDFGAAVIQSENLVRPVIGGFPNQSVESTFQGLWWFSYGNLEAANSGSSVAGWGTNPKRLTVYPWQTTTTSLWILPVGKTLFLPVDATVEMNVSFDYLTQGITVNTVYPTSGGGGQRAGRFVLCRRDRSTNAITEDTDSEVYVYPTNDGFVNAPRTPWNANTFMIEPVVAGHYDFFLAYKRLTADALTVFQIDIARVIGKIEAF